MTEYNKLDDDTMQALTDLSTSSGWGDAKLRRIFNFKARQLITLYERGGLQNYTIPGNSSYSSNTAYTAAVTSAMQVQNFRDVESPGEIIEMHKRLVDNNGKPPPLSEIFPDELNKPNLKTRMPS
jgi:hypothetical protein